MTGSRRSRDDPNMTKVYDGTFHVRQNRDLQGPSPYDWDKKMARKNKNQQKNMTLDWIVHQAAHSFLSKADLLGVHTTVARWHKKTKNHDNNVTLD